MTFFVFLLSVALAAEPAAPDFVAAGACAQAELTDGQPAQVTHQAVGDMHYWMVMCEMFAYQGTFEIWTAKGPVKASSGTPLGGLGFPSFDAEKKQVSWLEKARGVGDCGDWYLYGLDGSLVAHRSRSCEAKTAYAEPDTWPKVGPAPVGILKGVEQGDRACYLTLTEGADDRTYLAGFDLCSPETEGLVGKKVGVHLAFGEVIASSCEGDPECTSYEMVALANKLTPTK